MELIRTLEWIANEIKNLKDSGVEIALVIGGGNIIIRGQGLAQDGMHRVTADQMGMLKHSYKRSSDPRCIREKRHVCEGNVRY